MTESSHRYLSWLSECFVNILVSSCRMHQQLGFFHQSRISIVLTVLFTSSGLMMRRQSDFIYLLKRGRSVINTGTQSPWCQPGLYNIYFPLGSNELDIKKVSESIRALSVSQSYILCLIAQLIWTVCVCVFPWLIRFVWSLYLFLFLLSLRLFFFPSLPICTRWILYVFTPTSAVWESFLYPLTLNTLFSLQMFSLCWHSLFSYVELFHICSLRCLCTYSVGQQYICV